ncbi:MAG: 50S ribosomal protein L23 [Methermicoccaceae archaeon]
MHIKNISSIIKHPLVSEKAMMLLEQQGTLQIIVDIRANKSDIKRAVESLYGFEVSRVNTMITSDGNKKAILSFIQADAAHEIASRMGVY